MDRDGPRPGPEVALSRARKLLAAGEVGEASRILEEAYTEAGPRRDPAVLATLLIELGRAVAIAGFLDQAVLSLERAIGDARASGRPELEAEAQLAMAEQRVRLGDETRARAALDEAVRLLDDAFVAASMAGDRDHALEVAERSRRARGRQAALGRAAAEPRTVATGRDDEPSRRERNLLRTLFEVSRRIAAERDPERLVAAILDGAVHVTGAERGFVLLAADGAEASDVAERALPHGMRIAAARNFDRADLRRPELKVSTTIIERALESKKPVLVHDASRDSDLAAHSSVRDHALRSVACVPFESPRDGLRGAIYLDNRFGAETFREADLPTLAAFAAHAVLTLESATLGARLARRAVELEQARSCAEDLARRLEAALARQGDELDRVTARLVETGEQPAARAGLGELVGRAASMQPVYKLLERFKESSAPALVRGESGTGKELVARAMHFEGPRRAGPFVSESCSAIPETLVESVLFGHERGAFTGAATRRAGLFELASSGTLFLDEVAELTPTCQAKLLRVLQEGKVRPLGAGAELPVDVRVIAATHRDLEAMVRDGRFREDLYFRLNVLAIRLPPLRERRDDVPLLVSTLMKKHAPGGEGPAMPPEVLRVLLNHSWPGNVREMENEVKRLIALRKPGELVALEDLSPSVRGEDRPLGGGALALNPEAPATLEESERRALLAALKAAHGSKSRAANILGVPRTTLYYRLRKHGIDGGGLLA